MKKVHLKSRVFIALCCAVLLPASLIAKGNYAEEDTYLNHLVELNKEWNKHKSAYPKGVIRFESDTDRIQLHLKLVIKHLYKNPPKDLTITQAKKRINLLAELNHYADSKEFPQNKYHATRQPYFVDENDVHCAVGYLIAISGHQDLVERIRSEHNYDYIEDIKTPGIQEWATEHGFTLDELKWIQPTYAPTTQIDSISYGTNNVVNDVTYDSWKQRIIFSGEFDQLDNLPCLHIGYYKNGQLSCLGNGINGVINDVFAHANGVFVFGALDDGTTIYPAAFYDGTDWSYMGIPGRNGAVATTGISGYYGQKCQVAISHPSMPGKQEIWALTTSNVWEKKAQVNGIILDGEPVEYAGYGKVFGGHFDSISVYDGTGILDTSFAVYNVVIEQTATSWHGIEDGVSDTVKTIKLIGGALFFGGTCSTSPGLSNICLTRYYNGDFQPLLLRDSYYYSDGDFSINTMTYNGGYSFVIGGNFSIDGMYYGQHLAAYNLITNHLDLMALFNGQVNGLACMGNTIYIGGDFTDNHPSRPMHYIAQTTDYAEIDETVTAKNVKVYPNPFTDKITVDGISAGTLYSIINASGQAIQAGSLEENIISGLDELPKGVYFLILKTEHGQVTHRVVK